MKNKNLKTVHGQIMSKMGFSFVELIIVISIIALISVIGVSINNNYTERSKNSKITSDITTIKNSLESYKNEVKTLPEPKGNRKYFDDSSNYVHYDDITAFGVYGNITEDTIPKKYMNYTPIDPRTNQYYAYAKTLTGPMLFEIAGINKDNGRYESKVVGDYTGETGPYNLIREYNGPDFVYDKSKNNFPYNPDERIIKGKIGIFSGIVKVNSMLIDKTWIENNDLVSGDTIEVATGGEAQIYYSDGSKSYLGDPAKASKLTLANMVYKDENNLFTKIQLTLDFGSIWTKTSKLDDNSEFEIYTTDTEAAVRGTVFGVEKNTSMTYIRVQTGSVEINRISEPSLDGLIDKLENNQPIPKESLSISTTSANLTTLGSTAIFSSTGHVLELHMGTTIYFSPSIQTPPVINDDGLTNITPKILSITAGEVVLEFPSSFSGANKKVIKDNSSTLTNISDYKFESNKLTLSGAIFPANYNIKVCDSTKTKCTKEININKELSYGDAPTLPVGCAGDELQFSGDYNGCVDQDDSLVANGYHLVAYAPYDVVGDLNLYYNTGAYSFPSSNSGIKTPSNPNTYNFVSGAFIACNFVNLPNSLCQIGTSTGIFIDNQSGSEYIEYSSLSPLGLGTDFAIELNVRAGALKRTEQYTLFKSSYYQLFMLYSGVEKIRLSTGSSVLTNLMTDFPLSLNNNIFHNVIFKKDGSAGYIYVNGTSSGISSPISNSLGSQIFIGSINTSSSTAQWNDIIDYVKIYKKN